MKIVNLEAKEFDSYVYNSIKPHFEQTSAWAEVNNERGFKTHLLGLKDNDQLLGAAMLIEKKILMYSSFYCPRGFICDYQNPKILENFMKLLKQYVYDHKGLYLKFDPDIIIRKLDKDTNVKEELEDNLKLIEEFKKYGAVHHGFTTDFASTAAPRFTFRVNIDKDEKEIFDNFHATTRTILRKNNPYHIEITKNGETDLKDFYQVMKETLYRKKMTVESFEFYRTFYETLRKHDMADIYTARISIPSLKKQYEDQLNSVLKEIESLKEKPDNRKKENSLKDLNDRLNKLKKELNIIKDIKEESLILSSMITSKFKDTVWTIHGGNSDQLSFINANYELYYHILKDSKNMGYKQVDFYGSEGKIDKNSAIYGIFLFKLRFGGDFDEFSGEYDIIARPLTNYVIMKLVRFRRMILREISLLKK